MTEASSHIVRLWYLPLAIVGVATLVGIILDRVLIRYLHRSALRTKWEGDEIILHHLNWRVSWWGFLVGVAISLPMTPLPAKLVLWLNRGVQVMLTFSLTWVLSSMLAHLVRSAAISPSGAATSTIFQLLARVGVWGLGVAVMLHIMGVSIAPIITALGVGGLAMALALQDSLANLFAGIHILLAKQVQIGDYIKLESGEEGYVIDINWRNTTLRALPNNAIIVPNTKLASSIAVNYNQPEQSLSVLIPVSVAYQSDLERVEQVTLQVAKEVITSVPGGVADFEPLVRFQRFGESAIEFTVVLRAQEFVAQYPLRHEFIKRLHRRYREEGIEIPYPQRVIHLSNPFPPNPPSPG